MRRNGEDRDYRWKNPARSGKEYRLAQAVLSGYSDLMSKRVAREIVDETPTNLRSQYMKKNIKNSGESLSEAKSLTEGFHGRKAQYVEDIIEIERYRTKLAHLGDLIEFEILDHRSNKHVIPINFAAPDTEEHVSIGFPNRYQLILSGGNQSIDLDSFPALSNNEREKDYVQIGSIFSISYFTDKHHLEGPKYQADGTEYIHKFGEEEGGELPTLVYDRLNEHMMLVGGSYEIRDEGIYN